MMSPSYTGAAVASSYSSSSSSNHRLRVPSQTKRKHQRCELEVSARPSQTVIESQVRVVVVSGRSSICRSEGDTACGRGQQRRNLSRHKSVCLFASLAISLSVLQVHLPSGVQASHWPAHEQPTKLYLESQSQPRVQRQQQQSQQQQQQQQASLNGGKSRRGEVLSSRPKAALGKYSRQVDAYDASGKLIKRRLVGGRIMSSVVGGPLRGRQRQRGTFN